MEGNRGVGTGLLRLMVGGWRETAVYRTRSGYVRKDTGQICYTRIPVSLKKSTDNSARSMLELGIWRVVPETFVLCTIWMRWRTEIEEQDPGRNVKYAIRLCTLRSAVKRNFNA